MFENIGKKVKGLTVFVFVCGCIGSLIAAFMSKNFFSGLLIFAIGVLASWISSWALYAIGEAADSSEKIDALTSKIDTLERKIDKLQKGSFSEADKPKASYVQTKTSATQMVNKNEFSEAAPIPKPAADENGLITCPKCGTKLWSWSNSPNCPHCGVLFK